jgi:putative hydrolase of the HAD superfamily
LIARTSDRTAAPGRGPVAPGSIPGRSATVPRMQFRAVIFDLGGVVFPSPFDAFAAHERGAGLPDRFIRTVVAESADTGAWARFERSELDFAEFCTAFEAECEAAGGAVDAASLMAAIGAGFDPRPEMVVAIGRLRDAGLRVGALTNNWVANRDRSEIGPGAIEFDTVVESAVEGIRKPDPAIYHLVCARLSVEPDGCVFLDDLGVNLKPARELGMTTIKVVDPRAALVELSDHLGLDLVDA